LYSAGREKQLLFAETAHWISADRTIPAQPAMAQGRQISSAQTLPGEDSRQEQIQNGYFMKHATSGQANHRHLPDTTDQKHRAR